MRRSILVVIIFSLCLSSTVCRIFSGELQQSGCFSLLGSFAFYNMQAGNFEGNNFKFEIMFPSRYLVGDTPSFNMVIYVDRDQATNITSQRFLSNKATCLNKFQNAGRPNGYVDIFKYFTTTLTVDVDPPPAYKLPKGRNWTKLTGETVIYQGSPRQWRFALIHTNAVRKHISAFGSSEIAKSASGRCDGVTCYEEFEYADGPLMNISYLVTTTNQPGALQHVSYDELAPMIITYVCVFLQLSTLLFGAISMSIVSSTTNSRAKYSSCSANGMHPVVWMTYASAISLLLFFLSMGIHYIVLCTAGSGMTPRQISGVQMFYIIADTSFLAVLLLIAKGWAIVRRKLSAVGRIKLGILLSSYVFLQLFLLGWKVQAFTDASAAQSYKYFNPPSIALLALRVVALLEFSWALFTTFSNFKAKKRFYIKFAIFGGLWIGLPVVVTVCSAAVSEVYRDGVTYGYEMLALVVCQFVLIFLFCPLECLSVVSVSSLTHLHSSTLLRPARINKSFPFHQISTSMKTEIDLRNAASNGNLKTVQALCLIHPEWLNSELDKKTGATALMFAASRGRLNVIKYLMSIPFIKIQQEDKAGRKALQYCEGAGKEFAHMNEMLHLLGLDTPPVEMLWNMGETPEEVSSLGMKAFPDEFKNFKGNHIQKVVQASKAMTHKLSRLMKTVNDLKKILDKMQRPERDDLVVEGVGLDDKPDGRDDSNFDDRNNDRDDDHMSEQKTDAHRPRDGDEVKTQDDRGDEQPRRRREPRPAEPDDEEKIQYEADRVKEKFAEQDERGKDLLQKEHQESQTQLADRLERRREDRRNQDGTADDEAKHTEAEQNEKPEEQPEDKPEDDDTQTGKSQRRRRRRRKENDEDENAAPAASAEATGEDGGEEGEKKKKRSKKRTKRSRRRERAGEGEQKPNEDGNKTESSERKSRRRRDAGGKRRRRRRTGDGDDDAPKEE